MAGLIGRVQRVAQALEQRRLLERMNIHELVQWVAEEVEALYPPDDGGPNDQATRRIAAVLIAQGHRAEAGDDPGPWPADAPAIGPRLAALIEADHATWLAEHGKRR